MTLRLTMEHTVGCRWPEGCSCGANEINALRQQLADATRRAEEAEQALVNAEHDRDMFSKSWSEVHDELLAARARIAELEGLLRGACNVMRANGCFNRAMECEQAIASPDAKGGAPNCPACRLPIDAGGPHECPTKGESR